MSDEGIEQIEFRWLDNYDLTPIAGSLHDDPLERWRRFLKQYVRSPAGDPRTVPSDQRLYLTSESHEAAYIMRGNQPGARRVAQVESGRHGLVARALIGPAHLLTPELALRMSVISPELMLGQAPGMVDRDTRLTQLWAGDLAKLTTQGAVELTGRAKASLWLAKLIAARLRDPGAPLTVLVPDEDLSLYAGPAIPLLWGLLHTAGPILDGLPQSAANGALPVPWLKTFSSFEMPQNEGEDRKLPHVVFQAGSGPVRGRAPVLLINEGLAEDKWDSWAAGLAKAFSELGTDLGSNLPMGRLRELDLEGRLTHLTYDPNLRQYWRRREGAAQPTAHSGAWPSSSIPPVPAPPVPAPPAQAPQSPPQDLPPEQAATAPAPAPPPEPPADLSFERLYRTLHSVQGEERFSEVLALILVKARRGAPLSANQSRQVLQGIRSSGWYAPRLTADFGDRAVYALSSLLEPVLTGLLQNPSTFEDVGMWRDTPPLVRRAMANARLKIHDKPGETLERFLFRLVEHPYEPPYSAPANKAWRQEVAPDSSAKAPGHVLGMPMDLPYGVVAIGLWIAVLAIVVSFLWVARVVIFG